MAPKAKPTASFRHAVARRVAVALVALLGITGGSLILLESLFAENQLQRDMNLLASLLAERSANLLTGSDTTANIVLASGQFHKYVERICLYDAHNHLFAHYEQAPPIDACPATLVLKNLRHSADHLHILSAVPNRGAYGGNLLITANRAYIFDALVYFVPLMCVLVIILAFLALRTVNRVLRRAIAPLEDLHETVLESSATALSERRAKRTSDDEIGELVTVFNRMLDNLSAENKRLQSSENRFRSLAAHAPIGIFQLDTERRIRYANDKWYAITNIERSAHAMAAFHTHLAKDDQDRHFLAWEKSLSEKSPGSSEFRYCRQGREQYLLEHMAPLEQDGQIIGFIGTLADVTELKTTQKELEKLAYYDPLTNLPNRRFFRDLLSFGLAKAKRANAMAAVLMVDMDNFKKVNDLLGHSGGDTLLQRQAQRIRAAVREQDAVSRMGGDEFTIMLSPIKEPAEVNILARRVLDALNAPISIGTHNLEVGASIGIALYPADGLAIEDLLRNADMALYQAKHHGRNRVNFFSSQLDVELRENLRIEHKLKSAIRQQQLDIFIQPQFNAAGNQVVWAEALLRWQDAEEGAITPGRFIPIAEETGLIHNLGAWVIEQICCHLAQHHSSLNAMGVKGIAINLSGRQFYSPTLLKDIARIMQEYAIDPAIVEFELTESVVMGDIQSAIDVMKGLRQLGCRIAIDDFGTGYSSLSYLKRFPINALKIDRSFVEDIPHDTHGSEIATAIIAMAHKLHLQVVAEGVETHAQRAFLAAQGCELMQGFLFGKPRDIHAVIREGQALLARNRTAAEA